MSELIAVNYDTQTVSARELHEKLRIGTKFTTWFERMCEYGFEDGKEFFPKMGKFQKWEKPLNREVGHMLTMIFP